MTHKVSFLMSLAVVLGVTWIVPALGADPKEGLIGYWKLDGDTLDSSRLRNHGRAVGNPTFVEGLSGQAMSFDGNGDYLVIDSVADDFTNNDLTLSAWIKTADQGVWQWWFSANTASGGNVVILGLISGNITVYQGAALQITSKAVVHNMEWHHVVYSRIGSVGSLYVDGVPEGTHTANFQLNANDRWSIAQEWDSATAGDFLTGTVDEVRIYDRGLTAEEMPQILKAPSPGAASDPSPADWAADVPRDVVLRWTPGKFAPAVNGHKVYLGGSFQDVDNGVGGVVQSAGSFTPAQRLEFGTTYYWRVDEVNSAPDFTVFPGEIWRFTVEPVSVPLAGTRITATASSSSSPAEGPANTSNGAGLGAGDVHSTTTTDMWLSGAVGAGESAWICYEFDNIYALHQMLVWNHNTMTEAIIGFGIKEAIIEYSLDGSAWTRLGDRHTFARASGGSSYTWNTMVDFGQAAAKFVRLTAASNWGGILPQYGLSEVRFLTIPMAAREPSPAPGATDLAPPLTLSWRAGRQAVRHDVYLSTDRQAVLDGTAPAVTVSQPTFEPATLLGQTYYWKVNEVNEAAAVKVWAGDVWSFSTCSSLVVDDFESYTVDEGNRIYQIWIDGWENKTGSQVGSIDPPFAEPTILHGGRQSMPVTYNNAATPFYSEAVRTFDTPQDWTKHGITTLIVYFRGALGNDGKLYVKINSTKVPYNGAAADLASVIWRPWSIDLSAVNVNLASIKTLTIGVEGANAKGILYLDDILLSSKGVPTLKPVEPSNANLVACYPLDGDTKDSSANHHDGVLVGGPTYVPGMHGQALQFDGADDHVRIAKHDQLNPGAGDFSITFWANVDPTPGTAGGTNWDLVVARRDTGNKGYYVGADRNQGTASQTGYKFMLGNTSANRVDTPYVIVPVGEWVFVAAVLDRANNVHKISVDGGQTWATAKPPTGQIAPAVDLAIGWDIGPNNYWFHGMIDEVRLYRQALTPQEVAWLAQ